MRYNRLGNTGLFVSELCFGTMTFGGAGYGAVMGNVQQSTADQLIARALEAGVNFLDTADMYSEGESEMMTGQALRNLKVPRDQIVVATKVFGETGPGPNQRGLSRGHILDACKASLARLKLDHIDLYQLHGFDPATPIEESLSALTDLVRQGHVRYVGISNWTAWQVTKALGLAALRDFEQLVSIQSYYSLAGRELEREVLPMAVSEGLGVLVWSPLAGGLLGGKVRRDAGPAADSRRATLPFPPVDWDRTYDIIDVLASLSKAKSVPIARLAIAWLLHQRGIASVILGAKRLDQLEDTILASEVTFAPEELATLDDASKLATEYPKWMTDIWSSNRAAQLAGSRN